VQPRLLTTLALAALLQATYSFRVQMLEIYNEQLRDLLADGKSFAANRLEILATQASGCNVPGAKQVCGKLQAGGIPPASPGCSCDFQDDHNTVACRPLLFCLTSVHQFTFATSLNGDDAAFTPAEPSFISLKLMDQARLDVPAPICGR
jgi:hypothetical protein